MITKSYLKKWYKKHDSKKDVPLKQCDRAHEFVKHPKLFLPRAPGPGVKNFVH